ncbi:mechanosensitive ion channel [Pseudodesulfovibrio sp. F-1]|uniref:Mechanosensitive ion channel n=1 Tax=Pseudodesulfovibrio alkaliphilus TaxID=2661613 RepID=A0A7K1KL17_9BACT|nr:mechanosensitive ion channel domain-containing protein [Pseudodesulfovibrio alkaliphilus]MUM76641.1 mechanosensitive ion channel [Pseudodesulfovibrio alkaliphilus]
MEPLNILGWALRAAAAAAVLAGCVAAMRWLRAKRGGSDRLWTMLATEMTPKVAPLALAVAALAALSALVPMGALEPGVASLALSLIGGAWVLLAAWAMTLVCRGLAVLVDWKYDVSVADNLGARQVHTKVKVLQRIVVVLIWLGALAGVLMQFERFRMLGGTLLASAGVLSIVLGLSAQKTFGSVIAGIQIALTHPINLDDVVIVEGEWGRIEEITFTYVVVRIWDMRRLVVPITYFLDTPFQNWTRKSAEILGPVFLHVDYATPLGPLREELLRLCREAGELWNGKTCVLQVTEAGPETMTVRALVSASDASRAWDLRCLVREGLIAYLRANHPQALPRRRVVLEQGADKDGVVVSGVE